MGSASKKKAEEGGVKIIPCVHKKQNPVRIEKKTTRERIVLLEGPTVAISGIRIRIYIYIRAVMTTTTTRRFNHFSHPKYFFLSFLVYAYTKILRVCIIILCMCYLPPPS